jgi:hypothetical protein
MKNMILAAAFIFAVSTGVYASPPSDILFSFDTAAHTARIDIMHETKNPKEHFIYNIEVKLNGKKIITQTASEQTDDQKQSLIYVIPGLKAGDKVAVDADCNKYGDMIKEAVVKDNSVQKEKKKKLGD